ncbi:MAG: hypothetical protein ACI9QL_002095 [Candidatus Omnitrophota bacterium]|jgi:hypothetical protein
MPYFRCFLIALFTLLPLFARTGVCGEVEINEFLAINSSGLQDEDGEFSDWIELKNTTGAAINLAGWSLTDDKLVLKKWIFPSQTLAAGGYLIIFASDKNRVLAGAELHANFKLSGSGEKLAVVRPDNSIAHEFDPAYPGQVEDVSYGTPSGGGAAAYLAPPTPGVANGTAYLPPVDVSEDNRLFTGTLMVGLSTPSPGAVIRYTLNGTDPTAASTLYASPIAITNTLTLKATAFVGAQASEPVVRRFVLLAADILSFDSDLPLVVVDTYGQTIDGNTPRFSFMAIIDPNATTQRASITDAAEFADTMEINIRGSSSGGFPKKQFKVELKTESGEEQDASLLGMGSESDWILYAPGRYDRNMMANPFIYSLSKDMGAFAIDTQFVEVFVNEDGGPVQLADYGGIYNLTESIKWGPNRVDIDKINATDNAVPEITGGYILSIDRADNNQHRFTTPSNMTANVIYPRNNAMTATQRSWISGHLGSIEAALYGPDVDDPVLGYEAYIDPAAWADYHILNVIAKNADALRLSAFFYKERDGLLKYGPQWDYDRSLESDDGRDNDPTGFGGGTPFYTFEWWAPLFESEEFSLQYIDRWYAWRRTELSLSSMFARIDAYQAEIAEAYLREDARWGSTGGYGSRFTDLQGEVDHLKAWLTTRMTWMDGAFDAPPVFNQYGGDVLPGFQVTLSLPGATGTMYYTTDGSDPRLRGGGISPLAVAYSGPITLTSSTQFRARVYDPLTPHWNGGDWSAVASPLFLIDGITLAITEFMYNPGPPTASESGFLSSDFEYIELRNTGGTPVPLTGLLIDGGIDFDFSSAPFTQLGAGEFMLVVNDLNGFKVRYPSWPTMNIAGEFSGNLSNGGESIRLMNSAISTNTAFSYSDAWYPSTDGNGFSLTVVAPEPRHTGLSQKLSWQSSYSPNGSPGGEDSVSLPPSGTIVINELLTHQDVDNPGDWIELHNTSGSAVDISGWYLSDNPGNPTKFQLPGSTVLAAGGYVTFTEFAHFGLAANGALNGFGLSEHGESVHLAAPNGATVDARDFDGAKKGVSLGRFVKSTGGVDFPAMVSPTFNAANTGPNVGPVVLSEIMYHPLPGAYEFIELINITGSPVDLFDPAVPTNVWRVSGCGFDFPLATTLAANELIVLVESVITPEAFRTLHAIDAGIRIFNFPGSLSNGGESLRLQQPDTPDETGVPYIDVDRVVYNDSSPWVSSPDGNGPSLERNNHFGYGNEPQNWLASALNGGTPGSTSPFVLLTSSTTTGGSITPLGTVQVPQNGGTNYVISADPFYHIADVILDGTTSLGPVTSYTFVNVTGHRSIHAQVLQDTAALGTPHWWLNASNPAWVDNFDAHEVSDTDGDGAPAWKEFLGDSDPGDILSEFVLEDVTVSNAQLTLSWNSRQQGVLPSPREYALYRASGSFVNGSAWSRVVGGIARQGDSTQVIEDLDLMPANTGVYRITVDGIGGSFTEAAVVAQRYALAEGRNFVAVPFTPLNNTLADVFPPSQLPAAATESSATVIDLWDVGSQTLATRYWNSNASGFLGWRVPGTFGDANGVAVDVGQGAIITIRTGQGNQTVYGVGLLPGILPSVSVADNGYTLTAVAAPTGITIANLGLVAGGFIGGSRFSASDRLLFYNEVTGRFDLAVWLYSPTMQWFKTDLSSGNRIVQPGESFLIQRRNRGSGFSWTAPLSYSIPAPGPM